MLTMGHKSSSQGVNSLIYEKSESSILRSNSCKKLALLYYPVYYHRQLTLQWYIIVNCINQIHQYIIGSQEIKGTILLRENVLFIYFYFANN